MRIGRICLVSRSLPLVSGPKIRNLTSKILERGSDVKTVDARATQASGAMPFRAAPEELPRAPAAVVLRRAAASGRACAGFGRGFGFRSVRRLQLRSPMDRS